jgi:hypothetical protein
MTLASAQETSNQGSRYKRLILLRTYFSCSFTHLHPEIVELYNLTPSIHLQDLFSSLYITYLFPLSSEEREPFILRTKLQFQNMLDLLLAGDLHNPQC